MAKIQEALQRIEEGEFGICEECGCEISEGRLEARPVTTLCIECKEDQENKEKLRPRPVNQFFSSHRSVLPYMIIDNYLKPLLRECDRGSAHSCAEDGTFCSSAFLISFFSSVRSDDFTT